MSEYKRSFIKSIEYNKKDIHCKKYYLGGKILCLSKEHSFKWRKTKLFNITISHKKLKDAIPVNQFDISQLFDFKNDIDINVKADIIIPVYNGYEYLKNLFDSVTNNTDTDYRLIVVNDNSSDERVLPLLKEYASIAKMIIINNENNEGFVKSVNKALKYTKNHVIILNTDAVVPPGWTSRLLYPILKNKKVASVTPFSNAATIFSLPEICKDNISDGDLNAINAQFAKLNIAPGCIKFPTGVGFCMALNKNAIKDVGMFDEIFEKGYGEENDWCQRAIKKGYINTVAPNLFVWHKHGGSFNKSEKQSLINNHLNIIKKRYPKYLKDIQEVFNNEKYSALRFFAELMYMKSVTAYIQVWFDHTWGGGTEHYTYNKIEELKNNTLILRIRNDGSNSFCLSYYYKNFHGEIILENYSDLKIIIGELSPDLIVVNNLASYKDILGTLDFIENLKKEGNYKISFRGHDFQCICPSVTMVNAKDEYCNSFSGQNCVECFKNFKNTPVKFNNIAVWQTKWSYFLNEVADDITVFSNSTKEIYIRFFPGIGKKTVVIPHIVPPLRKVNIPKHKDIIIGVLGDISIPKGLNIIRAVDKLLPEYKNIKVKIIGQCEKKHIKNIKITGKYSLPNLPDIIEKEKIDIIFITSICPETFSYTTEEAKLMGLPVACFNIGAPAERNSDGCIISEIDAQTALDEIILYVKIMRQVNV